MSKTPSTSWNQSAAWYRDLTHEGKGHYYHRQLILPALQPYLNFQAGDRVLDCGCGNGFLARHLPPNLTYWGVDIAPDLIHQAKTHARSAAQHFRVGDVTHPLNLPVSSFTHVFFILSLQNMRQPELALEESARSLENHGKMILVLNHPCFRIPLQSGWQAKAQQQQRWVARYLSPLTIPITIHPGQPHSETTYSFHFPLSFYFHTLRKQGLVVLDVAELASDKVSQGKYKRQENLSRSEIPLFLLLIAQKIRLPGTQPSKHEIMST